MLLLGNAYEWKYNAR